MPSLLPASSVTTFTGEPNMCPRCGKRVYFGKVASGQWVHALGWHGPTVMGLRAGPLGHTEGLGGGFGSEMGLGTQRDVPEEPAGMGPLGGAPGCRASSASCPLLCHLPGGWRGLNSCPRPTSVTCEAAEGWERCGRLGCTGLSRDFVYRGDVPTGRPLPRHVCRGAGVTFPPCPHSS